MLNFGIISVTLYAGLSFERGGGIVLVQIHVLHLPSAECLSRKVWYIKYFTLSPKYNITCSTITHSLRRTKMCIYNATFNATLIRKNMLFCPERKCVYM